MVCWHVDDLFIGHENPVVSTGFTSWLSARYDTHDKNSTSYAAPNMTIWG